MLASSVFQNCMTPSTCNESAVNELFKLFSISPVIPKKTNQNESIKELTKSKKEITQEKEFAINSTNYKPGNVTAAIKILTQGNKYIQLKDSNLEPKNLLQFTNVVQGAILLLKTYKNKISLEELSLEKSVANFLTFATEKNVELKTALITFSELLIDFKKVKISIKTQHNSEPTVLKGSLKDILFPNLEFTGIEHYPEYLKLTIVYKLNALRYLVVKEYLPDLNIIANDEVYFTELQKIIKSIQTLSGIDISMSAKFANRFIKTIYDIYQLIKTNPNCLKLSVYGIQAYSFTNLQKDDLLNLINHIYNNISTFEKVHLSHLAETKVNDLNKYLTFCNEIIKKKFIKNYEKLNFLHSTKLIVKILNIEKKLDNGLISSRLFISLFDNTSQQHEKKQALTLGSLIHSILQSMIILYSYTDSKTENYAVLEETGQTLYKLRKSAKEQIKPNEIEMIMICIESFKNNIFGIGLASNNMDDSVSQEKLEKLLKSSYILCAGSIGFAQNVVDQNSKNNLITLEGLYEAQAMIVSSLKEYIDNWQQVIITSLEKATEIVNMDIFKNDTYPKERLKTISNIYFGISQKLFYTKHFDSSIKFILCSLETTSNRTDIDFVDLSRKFELAGTIYSNLSNYQYAIQMYARSVTHLVNNYFSAKPLNFLMDFVNNTVPSEKYELLKHEAPEGKTINRLEAIFSAISTILSKKPEYLFKKKYFNQIMLTSHLTSDDFKHLEVDRAHRNQYSLIIKAVIDEIYYYLMQKYDHSSSFKKHILSNSLNIYIGMNSPMEIFSPAVAQSLVNMAKCHLDGGAVEETNATLSEIESFSESKEWNIKFHLLRAELMHILIFENYKYGNDSTNQSFHLEERNSSKDLKIEQKENLYEKTKKYSATLKAHFDKLTTGQSKLLISELLMVSDFFASRQKIELETILLELCSFLQEKYEITDQPSTEMYLSSLVKQGNFQKAHSLSSNLLEKYPERELDGLLKPENVNLDEKSILFHISHGISKSISGELFQSEKIFEGILKLIGFSETAFAQMESQSSLFSVYLLSKYSYALGKINASTLLATQAYKRLASITSYYNSKYEKLGFEGYFIKPDNDVFEKKDSNESNEEIWLSLKEPSNYRLQQISYDLLKHLVVLYSTRGSKLESEYFALKLVDLANTLGYKSLTIQATLLYASVLVQQNKTDECKECLEKYFHIDGRNSTANENALDTSSIIQSVNNNIDIKEHGTPFFMETVLCIGNIFSKLGKYSESTQVYKYFAEKISKESEYEYRNEILNFLELQYEYDSYKNQSVQTVKDYDNIKLFVDSLSKDENSDNTKFSSKWKPNYPMNYILNNNYTEKDLYTKIEIIEDYLTDEYFESDYFLNSDNNAGIVSLYQTMGADIEQPKARGRPSKAVQTLIKNVSGLKYYLDNIYHALLNNDSFFPVSSYFLNILGALRVRVLVAYIRIIPTEKSSTMNEIIQTIGIGGNFDSWIQKQDLIINTLQKENIFGNSLSVIESLLKSDKVISDSKSGNSLLEPTINLVCPSIETIKHSLEPNLTAVSLFLDKKNELLYLVRYENDFANITPTKESPLVAVLSIPGYKEDLEKISEIIKRTEVSINSANSENLRSQESKIEWWSDRVDIDHNFKLLLSQIELGEKLECILERYSDSVGICKSEHLMMIIDKELVGIPLENTPSLRMSAICRMPSVESITSILERKQIMELEDQNRKNQTWNIFASHKSGLSSDILQHDSSIISPTNKIGKNSLKSNIDLLSKNQDNILESRFTRLSIGNEKIGKKFSADDFGNTGKYFDTEQIRDTMTIPSKDKLIYADSVNLYYLLNPSGDLERTQSMFENLLKQGHNGYWTGISGRAPLPQEILFGLQNNDIFMYFGHGGGEKYIRRSQLRLVKGLKSAILFGCSSAKLVYNGEYSSTGTPLDFMYLGSSYSVIGNLFDVGDKDIDRFSLEFYKLWKLDTVSSGKVGEVCECPKCNKGGHGHENGLSNIQALVLAREACKMKYITGCAPVVYGFPVYLIPKSTDSL
ncbi:hypothetical protein BB559_002856 [Furculomyces boomerangus]|uniref:separase n=1 Tax=Furculomyces boomerangus TaxID=61424 RepID=A0A2T9YRL4_9FUNG|nr:hypothetical protein BB559_002856 [Furculomyces boomerangus]